MELQQSILQTMAALLSYPQQNYKLLIKELMERIHILYPSFLDLSSFQEYIATTPISGIEEKFTQTFDMNKNSCLEIGWHLYGEDYHRGDFLVKMRQALKEYQINESEELPDHISHCLYLVAALDKDDAPVFIDRFLLPALKIIINNFDPANPYFSIVAFLQKFLIEWYAEQKNATEEATQKEQLTCSL